jgi:hypothetical protein
MPLTPEQQAMIDQQRGMTVIPSRTSVDSPWYTPADWGRHVDDTEARLIKNNASMASHNRLVNIGRLASIVPLGVAAAPAFGVGAGATAGATAGVPSAATTGATTGTMARLGSIMSSRGLETGINSALSLFGMRAQNKANTQARKDALAMQAKEIELAQQQLATEAQNANLDREDARALNAAIQELEKKKFALAQEQAQFERGILESDQAAKTNYRTTMQEPAMRRMSSILGLS